jgi:hypothetical protein
MGVKTKEQKVKKINMTKITEIMSKKTGISTNEIDKVFDAFADVFPLIVRRYSPTKIGDETLFVTPHLAFKTICAGRWSSKDNKIKRIMVICNCSPSKILLAAANVKLVRKGLLKLDDIKGKQGYEN